MARVEIPTVVLDPATGSAIAGASVELRDRTTGNLSTVYLAETGSTTVTNPRVTDAYGRVNGWVERGPYQLEISGSGLTTYIEYLDAVPASQGTNVSATAPTQPATGDLWYDTNSGELLINYDSQWVAPLAPATVPTASASTITHLNQEGSSLSFARADHDHRVKATGAFFAWRSASTQNCTRDASTDLVFDSKASPGFDVSGWYNTATGRYEPKRAGYYRFSGHALMSGGGLYFLNLIKNGSQGFNLGADADGARPHGTTIVEMNGTTDYVSLSMYFIGGNQTATLSNSSSDSYFCGEYLGAAS